MKDLTNLRKIAEAATPGPWVYGDNRDGLGNKLHPAKFPGKYNPIADFEYTEDEDAEHIATFDPPAVLALLARLEQAEAVVARVREVLEHHTFVADDKYGDLPASQYYGDSELEAVAAKSIIRALDGEQG
ncbi:hypothetical protein MOMMJLID_CDS0038 [Arthrobacter phage 1191A]|nr:hypothetical protein MOMMJLID_CDS0038 [Arthrobacter phage 1191A]